MTTDTTEAAEGGESRTKDLLSLSVGDKLRFEEEKQAYTIQAKGDRYIVCTKPFDLKKTTLYTVVDMDKKIRGTENLVFGAGAETKEECEEMLERLEGRNINLGFTTEISHRNNVPLKVQDIKPKTKTEALKQSHDYLLETNGHGY